MKDDMPGEEEFDKILEDCDYALALDLALVDLVLDENMSPREEILQLRKQAETLTKKHWFGINHFAGSDRDICFLQGCVAPMWLYAVLALAVLWVAVWLWRDSLVIDKVSNKYVFVTGCDSGFGYVLCKKLERHGFQVLAGCLTQKGADDLQRGTGPNLKTILVDVTDASSVKMAMQWVQKETGGKGLWGLVNNAGRSVPMGPTEWMRTEDFHSTLRVNMMGVIETTLAFLPLIKKARGRIVNVASVLGRLAANGGGYCISKFGVESFSDCLRRDIHYFGIKVSIIEPGFFKTAVTSLEPIEKELHRLWNQLDPEVRDSYGEKYFEKYIKLQRFIMNTFCDPDLSKVTNCMIHALTAKYPRTRYSAGWDAKFAWIPFSYAPAFIVDSMLSAVLPRPAQSCS